MGSWALGRFDNQPLGGGGGAELEARRRRRLANDQIVLMRKAKQRKLMKWPFLFLLNSQCPLPNSLLPWPLSCPCCRTSGQNFRRNDRCQNLICVDCHFAALRLKKVTGARFEGPGNLIHREFCSWSVNTGAVRLVFGSPVSWPKKDRNQTRPRPQKTGPAVRSFYFWDVKTAKKPVNVNRSWPV